MHFVDGVCLTAKKPHFPAVRAEALWRFCVVVQDFFEGTVRLISLLASPLLSNAVCWLARTLSYTFET